MKKIIVTGGSGKAGKATIRELLAHNYDVFNIDVSSFLHAGHNISQSYTIIIIESGTCWICYTLD